MADVDIDLDKSGDDDESGDGRSGGAGGRRSNVFVKGRFGTTQYPPDTVCDRCGDRAVGVMIIERTRQRTDDLGDGEPLCGNHRDIVEEDEVADWDEVEFRRFVD